MGYNYYSSQYWTLKNVIPILTSQFYVLKFTSPTVKLFDTFTSVSGSAPAAIKVYLRSYNKLLTVDNIRKENKNEMWSDKRSNVFNEQRIAKILVVFRIYILLLVVREQLLVGYWL